MKKAIVVASFGCSIEDSRKKHTETIEDSVKDNFKVNSFITGLGNNEEAMNLFNEGSKECIKKNHNFSSENYKFLQNTKCEYFPCHKTDDVENFNCLFCYCPLYALKGDCGGNYVINNGIKDCSNCLVPHSKGSYERIMSKIKDVIKLGSDF